MGQWRKLGWKRRRRQILSGVFAFVCLSFALPVQASLLPTDFFDRMPEPGEGQAAISADYLSQDANGIIIASGDVDMAYLGYLARADRLVFNQSSNEIEFIGNVLIRDPDGTEYSADRIEVTGNFKKAILQSLVMVTPDGAMVTARTTDHDQDGKTILEDGTYSPCGTCIDAKGRRIGWRVRTQRMVYDQNNALIDLEEPVLEVLGVPVAWLPWMRLPDPSNPRANGFRLPSFAFSQPIGARLEFPYFYAANEHTDVTFIPTLLSRQGFLFNTILTHRFEGLGAINLGASGLYQLDRGAFSGQVGDRDWRGSAHIDARFTPTENWTFGGTYTAFTDAGYLKNYLYTDDDSLLNEAYGEYLTRQTFAEVRVQEFKVLGNITQATQDKQAYALPNAQFSHVQELGSEYGQLRISGEILGVRRVADSTTTTNGVPYVFGHAENKVHGTIEAGWTKQWTSAAGILLTPYVGMRGDLASYDGGSALLSGNSELFGVTPIAALDVRYPFVAVDGGSTHVIEPIAQLVYRGSDQSAVGITNDNAQSFVFDDTNLFSFNRFSGTDRQETGLRANIGAHYLANFEDGSYLDFIAGQSFHLAGVNALNTSDSAQAGTSTGLGTQSSYIVAGVQGAVTPGINFGAKAQVDPNSGTVKRTSVVGSVSTGGWRVSADYAFVAADLALGALTDQHDMGGSLRVPFDEYWYGTANAEWDLTAGDLIDHGAGIGYDDGYFRIEGIYSATGADALSPDSQSFKLSFKLKGADGSGYGI